MGTLDGVIRKLGRDAHVESGRSEKMEGSERPGEKRVTDKRRGGKLR